MAAPIVCDSENLRMLQEPPYRLVDLVIKADTEDALIEGKKGLSMLSELKSFHDLLLTENKLIQTIVRIRQAQLRREKEMQLLKRVKACLQRVPLMDRVFIIAGDILKDVKISLRGESGRLPCRESWAFLLHFISQYHALLQQTVSYCVATFQYLSSLITVGQMLQVFVIFMGICARVWQVSKTFSDKLAGVYNQLYPVQNYMVTSNSSWVFPDLPTKLVEPNNVLLLEDEKERVSGRVSDEIDPTSNSSRMTEYATADVDLPKPSNSSDSEEDIGVAVSIEECQNVMKRTAESKDADFPIASSSQEEGNELKKRKKMKRKKLIEASDSVGHMDETIKERNMFRSKYETKKQKKKKLKRTK